MNGPTKVGRADRIRAIIFQGDHDAGVAQRRHEPFRQRDAPSLTQPRTDRVAK